MRLFPLPEQEPDVMEVPSDKDSGFTLEDWIYEQRRIITNNNCQLLDEGWTYRDPGPPKPVLTPEQGDFSERRYAVWRLTESQIEGHAPCSYVKPNQAPSDYLEPPRVQIPVPLERREAAYIRCQRWVDENDFEKEFELMDTQQTAERCHRRFKLFFREKERRATYCRMELMAHSGKDKESKSVECNLTRNLKRKIDSSADDVVDVADKTTQAALIKSKFIFPIFG